MSDKVRLHLRLTPETYQLIGEYAKKDNCTTSNEFVEREVDVSPEALERLRGRCIQEVKKTGGAVTFVDAVKYQKGE